MRCGTFLKGDQVIHNGIIWISTVDNNVWEPGAVGAPWVSADTELEEPEEIPNPEEEPTSTYPEWAEPTSNNPYMTGNRVFFNDQLYESIIDNNVWSPATYPAGWQLITE